MKQHPTIQSSLDLVNKNDNYTHVQEYLHVCDLETMLGKVNIQFNKTFKEQKEQNITND